MDTVEGRCLERLDIPSSLERPSICRMDVDAQMVFDREWHIESGLNWLNNLALDNHMGLMQLELTHLNFNPPCMIFNFNSISIFPQHIATLLNLLLTWWFLIITQITSPLCPCMQILPLQITL